ncbi:MAG: hypothetical protein HGB10_02575 [Coriobacteriia bacterium]|nr:hypothetical protein [Coriobacteriia bacterium]
MAECERTSACIFFTDEAGYSPELWAKMRDAYCFTGDPSCARFRLLPYFAAEDIPHDLIPSDSERADTIIAEVTGGRDN